MQKKILKAVSDLGPKAVVTPSQLLALGNRRAVDTALSRLVASGQLRRVARGLYDVPRHDPQIGLLAAPVEAIVNAVALRDGVRIQPSGAWAANRLGLSTQVPMQPVFLTDGPRREIVLGKLKIRFRHTTPRNMATAGRLSGLVIQALRWLGREYVDADMVRILRARIDAAGRAELLADIGSAPAWIGEVMREVARGGHR